MPRDREKVRRRLQEAALALYGAQGYGATTTAQIAERAGVTERTFFRHFADKREVLFDGEAALSAILTGAVRDADPVLGPWATLLRAFGAAEAFLVANRHSAVARRRVIASSPPLQERELIKTMALTVKLAEALRERGGSERGASLAAQLGMAALGQAFSSWLDDEGESLVEHLARAFQDVRDLASQPDR